MFGLGNKNNKPGSGKRKRFPVFSVVLVCCFVFITAAFWINAMREAPGRVSADPALPASGLIDIVVLPPDDKHFDDNDNNDDDDDNIPETPAPHIMPLAVKVQGIYYNIYHPQNDAFVKCVELIEATSLNAIVIDVKEDHGFFTFPTENTELTGALNAFRRNYNYEQYGDLITREMLDDVKSRGIYTIARVVCFKDNLYAGANPEQALADRRGGTWRDRNGDRWIDPYNKDAWNYIAQICKEAVELGFDEIQLDYVRFPTEGQLSNINYGPAAEEHTRYQIINEFVTFIREEMAKAGVWTSADVFGIVGISNVDAMAVGQNLELLLGSLDSICPMIYPSLFANSGNPTEGGNGIGSYINGILFESPDLDPYGVVYNTLQHYRRQLEQFIDNNPDVQPAVIRPYLQYYTVTWFGEEHFMTYGPQEVIAQIRAVNDAGFEEWILWRQGDNAYSIDAIP